MGDTVLVSGSKSATLHCLSDTSSHSMLPDANWLSACPVVAGLPWLAQPQLVEAFLWHSWLVLNIAFFLLWAVG